MFSKSLKGFLWKTNVCFQEPVPEPESNGRQSKNFYSLFPKGRIKIGVFEVAHDNSQSQVDQTSIFFCSTKSKGVHQSSRHMMPKSVKLLANFFEISLRSLLSFHVMRVRSTLFLRASFQNKTKL